MSHGRILMKNKARINENAYLSTKDDLILNAARLLYGEIFEQAENFKKNR